MKILEISSIISPIYYLCGIGNLLIGFARVPHLLTACSGHCGNQ